MTTQKNPGMRTRVLVMVLLGTAAVAGVIAWPGGAAVDDDDFVVDRAQGGEATPLEVQPLLMRGRISGASWRTDGPQPEPDVQSTTLERDPQRSDARSERYRTSLEETVEPISGLGVYVAPVDAGGKARE